MHILRLHGDAYCIGSRKVLEVHEEKHQNHRSFHKLVLGEYEWKNYTEIDRYVAKVFNGLLALGLKKGDHVVIYAETRMEWLVSAIACFKSGLTGTFMGTFFFQF